MWVGLLAIVLQLTPATQPATTLATTQASQASNEAIQQVESLLARGDRAGAIRAFNAVDPAGPRAIEVRTQINQAADDLLADADKLIAAKNFPAAADRLSDLLTTMSGLPTASLARQHLAELCSRPEIQEQFKHKDFAAKGEAA